MSCPLICSASSTLLDWASTLMPERCLVTDGGEQIAIEPAHVGEHVADRVRPRHVEKRQHVAEVEIEIDEADAQRPRRCIAPARLTAIAVAPTPALGAEDGDHLPDLRAARP